MQQITGTDQNKKAPNPGRFFICNSKMVPLTHFVSNTF